MENVCFFPFVFHNYYINYQYLIVYLYNIHIYEFSRHIMKINQNIYRDIVRLEIFLYNYNLTYMLIEG